MLQTGHMFDSSSHAASYQWQELLPAENYTTWHKVGFCATLNY